MKTAWAEDIGFRVYVSPNIYIYTHMHVHAYIYMYVCMYAYMSMYTCTPRYVNIEICTCEHQFLLSTRTTINNSKRNYNHHYQIRRPVAITIENDDITILVAGVVLC